MGSYWYTEHGITFWCLSPSALLLQELLLFYTLRTWAQIDGINLHRPFGYHLWKSFRQFQPLFQVKLRAWLTEINHTQGYFSFFLQVSFSAITVRGKKWHAWINASSNRTFIQKVDCFLTLECTIYWSRIRSSNVHSTIENLLFGCHYCTTCRYSKHFYQHVRSCLKM